MTLRVVAPGPLATIQDAGRFGHRDRGVPTSGPFDRASAAMANALLGNDAGAAVVEMTGFGGTYMAESSLALAIAGAPMRCRIFRGDDGRDVLPPATFTLRAGDRLVVGGSAIGFRAYLAVLGGWDAPVRMGSRSSEATLQTGDLLQASPGACPSRTSDVFRVDRDDTRPIRVLDGPDADRVDLGEFESHRYTVSPRSDRTGLRLVGDPIATRADPDRLSSPVSPGAIQVAGGLPILLGPAAGTMGGYPHVAQVISADLDRLGQLRPGRAVRFVRVSLGVARRLDRERRRDIRALDLRLRTACGFSP